MRTKKEIKLLTKLLDIEGIKVISHRQHEGIGIILQVERMGKESNCPRCGKKSHRLHQNHRYLVKDLPWGEKFVFLEINRRQFKCEKCVKPFSEELEFVRQKRTYTKRLEKAIIYARSVRERYPQRSKKRGGDNIRNRKDVKRRIERILESPA
jgi:transposase